MAEALGELWAKALASGGEEQQGAVWRRAVDHLFHLFDKVRRSELICSSTPLIRCVGELI